MVSLQNTLDKVSSKTEDTRSHAEIPKERRISPEKRHYVIEKLRLICYIIMEYQKVINLLDNATNQLFKSRTKNRVGTMQVEPTTPIFKLRLQDKVKFMRLQ